MANSISYASKYTGELDKMIEQTAKTGFFKDEAFKARFAGSKTVYLPEMTMVGLGNYSRSGGYAKGDISLIHTPYTLSQERSRQLFIDAQDVDESGVDGLVGQMVGEYTRLHVVPEIDAYVLSKLHGVASTQSHTKTYAAATAVKDLLETIGAVEEANGYDGTELVAFIDPTMYNILQTSAELSRYIVISDFNHGGINTKVKKLNDVALIPVSAMRMKTAYTFNAGATTSAGGFAPTQAAKEIRAIVCPKTAANLVKKVDKIDVLDPHQVEDYDAYKINYRLYYDVFVKTSKKNTIFTIATA